jgi:cytochrome-b5 reductase
VKKLGLISGGTGITPMLQLIKAIFHHKDDNTEVSLIFANQTEEDIFLRSHLEELPQDRMHLWYTLDRPSAGWKYSTGFVNATMIREHLPPPAEDTMIFVCGPTPMVKFACEPAFSEIGYSEQQWFAF